MLTANFTKGSNGSNILLADPGDASQWDQVNNNVTNTMTYDSSRALLGGGVSACKMLQGGTPNTQQLVWVAQFGTQTDHYGRVYLWMDAYYSLANMAFINVQSGGSLAARIYINSSGNYVLSDSTGAGLGNTTIPLRRGQWTRMEWHMVHNASTGSVEVKLFNNPHSTVPTETVSITNKNTLASADRIAVMQGTGLTAGDTQWVGGVAMQAPAYPGPITMGSQPGVLSAAGGILG